MHTSQSVAAADGAIVDAVQAHLWQRAAKRIMQDTFETPCSGRMAALMSCATRSASTSVEQAATVTITHSTSKHRGLTMATMAADVSSAIMNWLAHLVAAVVDLQSRQAAARLVAQHTI